MQTLTIFSYKKKEDLEIYEEFEFQLGDRIYIYKIYKESISYYLKRKGKVQFQYKSSLSKSSLRALIEEWNISEANEKLEAIKKRL